jgi:acyl carrier protein
MTEPTGDQSSSILDAIIVIVSEQSGRPATAESNLVTDLGLDSLDLVSITMAIENQYPAIGSIDYDPAAMQTCRDVAAFVENRLKPANV